MAIITKDNSYNPFGCDNGDYLAVIDEIKEQESDKFDKKPFLIWNFKIKDPVRGGEYVDDAVFVSGTTPSVPVEGQKLDDWLQACNIRLSDGDDFDTDELVGKIVKVIVKTTADNKRRGGKKFCHVTDVLPIRKKPLRQSSETGERRKPLERVRDDVEDDIDAETQVMMDEVEERERTEKTKAKGKSKGSADKKTSNKAARAEEEAKKAEEEDLYGDFDDDADAGEEDVVEEKTTSAKDKLTPDEDVPF